MADLDVPAAHTKTNSDIDIDIDSDIDNNDPSLPEPVGTGTADNESSAAVTAPDKNVGVMIGEMIHVDPVETPTPHPLAATPTPTSVVVPEMEAALSHAASLADHLDNDDDDDDEEDQEDKGNDKGKDKNNDKDNKQPPEGRDSRNELVPEDAATPAEEVVEQTPNRASVSAEAAAKAATTNAATTTNAAAKGNPTSPGVNVHSISTHSVASSSASGSASASTSGSTSGSASAAPLLLKNRLSNWRQKANQNAVALWRKAQTTSSSVSVSSDQGDVTDGTSASGNGNAAGASGSGIGNAAGAGTNNNNNNNNSTSRPGLLSASPPWKIPLQRASLDSPPPPPPPPPPPKSGSSNVPNQQQQQQNRATAMDESYYSHDNDDDDDDDDNDNDGRSMSTDYTNDNDNDSSFVSGSSLTGTDDSRLFSRARLQMAASTVLDYSNSVSVQAGIYRGRYGNGGTAGGTGGTAGGTGTTNSGTGANAGSDANNKSRNRLPAVFSGTTGGTPGSTGGGHNISMTIPLTMTSTATTPSQTARILGSRQANHLQSLMDRLEAHEYIMLLGKGMLGVNLKQSFLKTSGTYVDYTVAGGAAASSGVVCVGDHMSAVGDASVHKETIWTVPVQIAQARRPVHLVLATSMPLPLHKIQHVDIVVAMMHQIRVQCRRERHQDSRNDTTNAIQANDNKNLNKNANHDDDDDDDDDKNSSSDKSMFVTPVKSGGSDAASLELDDIVAQPDLASVDKESKEGESSIVEDSSLPGGGVDGAPNQDHNEVDKTDENQGDNKQEPAETESTDGGRQEDQSMEQIDSVELVQPARSFELHQDDDDDLLAMVDVKIPIENTVDGFVNPAAPPLSVREAYQPHIAKRNNDDFDISELLQACATNENFRAALRNAFLTCTIDGRRFPFLARHLVQYEEENSRDDLTAGATGANAMFMLFLEMVNFSDLYGVIPVSRRRDIAKRIAYKFFLPTTIGEDLIPPVFDFHHLAPISSLRRLEAALNDSDDQSELPRDVFFDFQQAAVDSLSGKPFLSFLMSNECSRMRAYLRGTAPFVNVPLKDIFDSLVQKPTHVAGKNYFLYLLCYLLCRLEKENCGEHDITPDQPAGNRVEDAACGICAALFIRSVLVPLAQQARDVPAGSEDNDGVCTAVVSAFERFWEMFVAPGVGAIERSSHSNETSEYLKLVRNDLEETQLQALSIGSNGKDCQRRVVDLLVGSKIMSDISRLADELLYDYAVNSHSKFRFHKFYEWMCAETAKEENDPSAMTTSAPIPNIPPGCIKRLLRKADLPAGVSSHKPAHRSQLATPKPAVGEGNEKLEHSNAECAVVFGTSVGLDLATQMQGPVMDHADLRRYSCQAVGMSDEETFDAIGPDQIPATLESYAVVPPSRSKAFGNFAEDVYLSSDGWEATIVNFMIPRADATTEDGEEASLFGVSLVFQRRLMTTPSIPVARAKTFFPDAAAQSEATFDPTSSNSDTETEVGLNSDGSVVQTHDSVVSAETPKRSNVVELNSPIFAERLQERSWTERLSREVRDDDGSVTVGIALVSQRNVVFAMRETLVRLLRDFSRGPDETTTDLRECDALVNLLGNFAHQDVEPASLKSILEPFLRSASTPWLERPISAQKLGFEQMAGQQLIRSLPPVPLALLFVTALLEQKIVLSSSRRSILLSATVALQQLLRPLKWCHLIVPRVPSALAADLLQYPAPFILGMPSEDPGMMDLIRDLPNDVTLVDLDVGRVILAPSFAHNSEMGRGTPNNENTAGALRSQVLYLAQSLGGVFGARMDSPTWLCDQPLLTNYEQPSMPKHESEFDTLRSVCQSFLKELLAGTTSCCYWAEEGAQVALSSAKATVAIEPTVLFDEDRFFHIKNQRRSNGFRPLLPTMTAGSESSPLALGLDDFDLVLEIFLRCQCMNAYVSSRERNEMIFSL